MDDYISREAAIEKITALINKSGKYTAYESGADDACYIVEHEISAADVRPVVKCLECENALRDDSHKIVHCNQNGEPGYVWCKKEGCCRAEDFFCANGVSCSCGAGMREVKADG